MRFSTDLPHRRKAIAEHLASRQTLRMNVSKQADRAFCLALKNNRKSNRWANLEN